MIHRYYKNGESLDVAGLNRITVLVDRSETELTEVGWNTWKAGLDGPPHFHNDKDQVFYINEGSGRVKLGGQSYDVNPGCLVYVPAGTVHQTITSEGGQLSYMLFNVFNSAGKEGHATFADHIEKVKMIRKKQAESGNYNIDGERTIENTKQPKFFNNIFSGKKYDFGSNSTVLLIDRNESNKTELTLVSWPAGNNGAMVAHKEKEQTFFVLNGGGWVTIGNETEEVKPGDVIFVPKNTPHTTQAGNTELSYLCMNALSGDIYENTFEEMYNRVSPERIKRWKNGNLEVGE
jgi:mannose-6-phosphate isomerase-like protein (cupin superfamily)